LAAAAPDSLAGVHDPLRPANRQRLRKILQTGLSPTAAEIDAAEKEIQPFLGKAREGVLGESSPTGVALGIASLLTVFLTVAVLLTLLIGSIVPQRFLVWGGGPLAFVVVGAEGRLASRRRMFVRNLIAFAPFVLAIGSALFLPYAAASRYMAVSLVLFTGGVIWAIASPGRGVHDRIARTWLVPK
jgi:hypothetical protein